MKKIISKIPFFIFMLVVSVLATFIFGITVGGIKFFMIFSGLVFFGNCLIYRLYKTKFDSTRKLKKMLYCIDILIPAILLFFISVLFYYSMNRVKSEFVQEYDAVVTSVNYRYGGTAWFTDPFGREESADLHNWQIFYDENTISIGDEIHIIERKGLFDVHYCIIDEK